MKRLNWKIGKRIKPKRVDPKSPKPIDFSFNKFESPFQKNITHFTPPRMPEETLQNAFKPVLIMAQCFAAFPVSGITAPDASSLKFSWRSPKIIYVTYSLIGALLLGICFILRIVETGVNSTKMTTVVFFCTGSMSSVLFLHLARKWPSFMRMWENVEKEIAARPRRVSKISLSLKFKIVTLIVMILAAVEHGLSLLNGYIGALNCYKGTEGEDIVQIYFTAQFPQIFARTTYALWKGLLVQFANFLVTFSWNFTDLFLILLSIALADQFRQLNNRLYSVKGKTMPDWWWAEARIDYNRLANLTKSVDSYISPIVLLSFAANLYFICIQLLFTFNNPRRDIVQNIYFCFSFGFLLARTMSVSLFAASINDESLLPAPVLYSAGSTTYPTEVMRFLVQVTTAGIALTGMNFFSVKRSILLTVASKIVTYELVLVQFNASSTANDTYTADNCDVKFGVTILEN